MCAREDHPNIKTQLILGALKFAEFPDHISINYGHSLLKGFPKYRRFYNFL